MESVQRKLTLSLFSSFGTNPNHHSQQSSPNNLLLFTALINRDYFLLWSICLVIHALACSYNDIVGAMQNEFSLRVLQQQTNNTFPVRITPLSLTNKQLLNKIRINHQKLPSQFFANPRSMPDLAIPPQRTPVFENRKHREKSHFDEQTLQSKFGARSLRNYRSQEHNRQQRQRQLRVNSLFRQHDELGITFSRLPIRKVQNNAKKLHEFYNRTCLKRVSTEPCCEASQVLANLAKEDFGETVKIGNFIPSQKGISVRKNNHPLSTLREIKKQRQ